METLRPKPEFDILFDLSPDLLCLIDENGNFLKVNKYLIECLGYAEQDFLSKHFLELIHPDDHCNSVNYWNALLKNESSLSFVNRYQCFTGSYKSFSWNAVQLPDKTVYASARDLSCYINTQNLFSKIKLDNLPIEKPVLKSENEKQKKHLYRNEHRLEALLQSGNDMIGIISPAGVYQYVSPSVKNILNISPKSFVGKTPYDFIHPDDMERIKGAFEYILTTEDTVHVSPFRMIDGEGNWHWVESFATNMLNDPAIAGIVVNSKDISTKVKDEEEKRLAAEALRRSIERYTLVTEATKDVIWDWDLEKNQLSRDQGFEKYFGYTEDLISTSLNPWEAYIHPNDKERILKSIRQVINSPHEKFWKEEYRFIRANGSLAFISDKGYVIRNSAKKAIRMVGAMHDNTQLKEKELRILKQNLALREISQINSHVIRKPVATILGLMGILDKKSVCGKENLEIFECLEITTKELDMVIRRINDMSID